MPSSGFGCVVYWTPGLWQPCTMRLQMYSTQGTVNCAFSVHAQSASNNWGSHFEAFLHTGLDTMTKPLAAPVAALQAAPAQYSSNLQASLSLTQTQLAAALQARTPGHLLHVQLACPACLYSRMRAACVSMPENGLCASTTTQWVLQCTQHEGTMPSMVLPLSQPCRCTCRH